VARKSQRASPIQTVGSRAAALEFTWRNHVQTEATGCKNLGQRLEPESSTKRRELSRLKLRSNSPQARRRDRKSYPNHACKGQRHSFPTAPALLRPPNPAEAGKKARGPEYLSESAGRGEISARESAILPLVCGPATEEGGEERERIGEGGSPVAQVGFGPDRGSPFRYL
jgi:hypothetical protein